MKINILSLRAGIELTAEVMQKIAETPIHNMVWHEGKIVSLTLPSSSMRY